MLVEVTSKFFLITEIDTRTPPKDVNDPYVAGKKLLIVNFVSSCEINKATIQVTLWA